MPRGRGHGPRMSNEKAKDFKGTMKKLMAYLSTYKIGIFFVIVFAIGSTIFNIVGPRRYLEKQRPRYLKVWSEKYRAEPGLILTRSHILY